MQKQAEFKDKVALVTGGSSGIGLATARLLATRGAATVICGRGEDRLDRAVGELGNLGSPVLGIPCDVGKTDQVDNLFTEIRSSFGRLDICVCNAGIETDEAYSILDLPAAVFDENIETNLRGVFLTSQGAARMMKEQGGGAIVLIGSTSGIMADPLLPSPTYDASKAGVHMFAKSLALALAPHGIRVNAVAPGWIDTEMNKSTVENPDRLRTWMEKIPLSRFGRPEEVAEVIVFLSGDKSSYMTGAVVVVDGGEILG
ncbi:MAG: SDR family oxidoreductase [Spirochaetaceae bacterium]|nr:MAG: SDR family oxidoreductase [Spirochaetaceae bacterium]